MKLYHLFALLLYVSLLTGCYKEAPLVPTQMGSVADKFDFPQGTASYDEVFQRINNEYGIKVIYKDFTENDINRAWQSPTGGEISVGYIWNYLVDEQQLNTVAAILEQKVFPLLPDTIMKAASQAYPYMYLMDKLYAPSNMAHFALYPVNAFDGITVNLEATADSDNYSYRVFFPLRVAVEYFMFAFNKGMIPDLPSSFYTAVGSVSIFNYVSRYWAATRPDRYNDYWARNGELPSISSYSGRITIGQYSGWMRSSALPPITGSSWEVPYFFMYLSLDPNWRANFDTGGVFEDCDRLKTRVEMFYNYMKGYGIDFDKIQEILYSGTTVDKRSPWERMYIRNVTPSTEDANKYIYYDLNNYN